MNNKKSPKDLLFERMEKIDPSFKRRINEEFEEDTISIDSQEHGPEAPNYKAKLECIVNKAQKIYEGLPEDELPHWVQDKITLAEDYLMAIYSWMHGEEEEKEGEIEGPNREMDSDDLNENVYKNKYGYHTIDKPITSDAISVLSQNENAIEFRNKEEFDEALNNQRYFSASYSKTFDSMEDYNKMNENPNSVLLFDAGHELVAAWDDNNQIGYIVER